MDGHPRKLAACLLGAGVVAGSVALWLAVPYGCLWAVSKLGRDSTASLEILIVACPIAMVTFGYLLARINRLYLRAARVRAGNVLLEASMTLSAGAALVILIVWFFLFAHSSLPATVAP